MYPTFSLPSLCRNQSGSVAVSAALIMSVLLGVMVFSMDAGFLYYKKNALQNSVDAVALAGAQHLCEEDWEQVTRTIAAENGLPGQSPQLEVTTGFYDARDEFADDIGNAYKDFGPPPGGRYINSVYVRFTQTVSSLTGMNPDVTLVSEALAYLKRIDIASLDPTGSIHVGQNSIWENTTFFSNNRIDLADSVSANSKSYDSPQFTDCELFAADNIYKSGIKIRTDWLGKMQIEVLWGSGTPQSDSYMHSQVEQITEIPPVNEATLDYWRDRADQFYTPDQAGQDNIYYAKFESSYGNTYYVDPATDNEAERRVIFFDGGEGTTCTVKLGLVNGHANHQANGYTISNLTFATTCSVEILNNQPTQTGASPVPMHIGGEGNEQTFIISAADIQINPGEGGHIVFDGAVFRAGGDFIKKYLSNDGVLQHLRVIADGNIVGTSYMPHKNEAGLFAIWNNSLFGPPCPPGMARLGTLERVVN